VKIAEPLPECELCGTPTKREAWETNGRVCTPCGQGLAATVRMLPAGGGVVDLDRERARRRASEALTVPDANDLTVFVERYTPPVPGQLELPEVEL
jgi:hypothetical protein